MAWAGPNDLPWPLHLGVSMRVWQEDGELRQLGGHQHYLWDLQTYLPLIKMVLSVIRRHF